MRLLIAYPLSLMFVALVPACGEKHSLGELTGTTENNSETNSESGSETNSEGSSESVSESSGKPPETTGEPSETTGEPSETTDGPVGTASSSSETMTTEGDEDPCAQFVDKASCEAAECEFVEGATLVADADGCHWGDPVGFCASESGGADAPSLHCTPDQVPVVFAFDPFNLPADWTGCTCEEQGLALDCYGQAVNVEQLGCGALPAHCEALTDAASCNQFQGDQGLNGCLWVETTEEVAATMMCNGEQPVGQCIPVYLRHDGGCFDTNAPAACDPVEAAQHPYYAPAAEGVPTTEALTLIRDVSCEFEPLGFQPCWIEGEDPAGCECACGS